MKAIRTLIKYTSVLAFMFVLALAFCAVFFRYVLNNSIVWAEEIIRYVCIWVFFLTMCESTRNGAHLALDILPGAVHGRGKAVLSIVIEAVSLAFDAVLIWYGFQLAVVNLAQKSPALHIPYGWVYLAIPVGAALMALFGLQRMVRAAREVKEGRV